MDEFQFIDRFEKDKPGKAIFDLREELATLHSPRRNAQKVFWELFQNLEALRAKGIQVPTPVDLLIAKAAADLGLKITELF